MEDNNQNQGASNGVSFPTVNEPKKASSTKTLLIVGILILVAILGFVIYKTASSKTQDVSTEPTTNDELVTPSDTTVETFTPAPSPTAAAVTTDRSKIQIQIQNGTGITGEAAYLQNQLSDLGYKNVKVGNSDSTVTATVVTFSSSLDSGVVSEITQKLNSIYQTVTTRTSQSSSFDVVVVTGLRKGASPKPSGSPSASVKASATPTPKSSASASPKASSTPTSTP